MILSNRIKDCRADIINKLSIHIERQSQFYNESEYYNIIKYEVNSLSCRIVSNYSIKDCINIIISNGDIFDAIKKSEDIKLDSTNKLLYHRQLALPFIEEFIENKINIKLFLMKTHKEDRICSICFEEITNKTLTITKCKHIFHKCCLNKWSKKTCPMCRSNI